MAYIGVRKMDKATHVHRTPFANRERSIPAL